MRCFAHTFNFGCGFYEKITSQQVFMLFLYFVRVRSITPLRMEGFPSNLNDTFN